MPYNDNNDNEIMLAIKDYSDKHDNGRFYDMCVLYLAGYTKKEIGAIFGISQQAVSNYMIRYGKRFFEKEINR